MTNLLKLMPLLIALALLAGMPPAVSAQNEATVQFDPTEYTVDEDVGTFSITVTLSAAQSSALQVGVSTADGTAKAGLDYQSLDTTVTIPANTTSQTVDVTIYDSPHIQLDETFTLNLSRTTGLSSDITVSGTPATVTILESDEAILGFTHTSYVISENQASWRVVVKAFSPFVLCPISASFSFRMYTVPGTATPRQDYTPVDTIVTFDDCMRARALVIPILDDSVLEPEETFMIRLEPTADTPRGITFSPAEATVEISDNFDRATLSFVNSELTVSGGEPLELTVELLGDPTCPVDSNSDVHVGYVDPHGAIAPGTPNPMVVSFKPCDKESVVNVSTVSNSLFLETVSFRLQRPSDLDSRIRVLSSTTTLRVVPSQFGDLASHGNDGPWGMWSDRTTAWISNEDDHKLYAYDMATRDRVSGQDFDALDAAENDRPTGIWSNRTTMWVADYDDGKIYAYQMSDKARDSDKDYDTLSAAGNARPTGVWSNRTIMWVADYDDGKIYAYNMATKAREDAKDFNTLDPENNHPEGIWSNGITMWVADSHSTPGGNKIYAYSMTTKARDEDKDFDSLIAAGQSDPKGLWSDEQIMWVVDKANSTIYPYLLPNRGEQPTVRRPSSTQRIQVVSDDVEPASVTAVSQELCVGAVVDPDGGEVELGDTIADSWASGCPSITRGGRLAKYYTFSLPITTSTEIALDSHLGHLPGASEGRTFGQHSGPG